MGSSSPSRVRRLLDHLERRRAGPWVAARIRRRIAASTNSGYGCAEGAEGKLPDIDRKSPFRRTAKVALGETQAKNAFEPLHRICA